MKDILPEDTARTLMRRMAEQVRRTDERTVELLRKVRACVPKIASGMGLRSVYLFGSLIWGGTHSRSDVDLAVEGLQPEERASFHVAVSREVGLEVDVVLLEEAPAGLRERVFREGELLFSRPGEKE